MRKKEQKLVVSFETTTMAMLMEEKCHLGGMPGRLIPLPKEIDAGCGLAWSTDEFNQKKWMQFMKENQIVYKQMKELWI